MTKTRVRVTSGLLWVLLSLISFYHPSPAKAETYTATQNSRDFYFTSESAMTMTVRAYAQQYGIDSMLWVYRPDNSVVTQNDDYFGLDSFVSFEMQPGVTYRVRTGVCCGDPDRWYGTSYVIEPSMAPLNAPQTTTTLEQSTTTELPTTTVPPQTTSTSTTTSTTTTSTTTTTVPETTTTVPETTTTQPVRTTTTTEPVTVVATTTTEDPVPQTTTTLARPVTTTTSTTQPTQTTELTTTTTSLAPFVVTTTTTTIPPVVPDMAPEQALAIATSAETLQALSKEEATQVFESVDVAELTDEQAGELVAAVQDAPEDVRAAFEDKINIFDNKFSTYVPLGSNINVAQRKVLIAATGVLFMAPAVPSTSGSSRSTRRK